MGRIVIRLFTAVAIALVLAGCGKEKISNSEKYVNLRTGDATEVTPTSAKLTGSLKVVEQSVDEVGFIIDEYSKFNEKSSERILSGLVGEDFWATVKDLEHGTRYAYMAYAVISGKEERGSKKDFTTTTIAPSSITVSPSSVTLLLKTNETQQLTAVVKPDNATNKSYKWSSSKTSVATVDANGLVRAVGEGEADIIATTDVGGCTGKCKVTVSKVKVTGVSLDMDKAFIRKAIKTTLQLTATVTPSNAADKSLTWYSYSESTVKVSQTGLLTGVAPGECDVYCQTTDGGFRAYCTVTVLGKAGKAVDLGLDVKWADCNLGSELPYRRDFWFSWGEVLPKYPYTEANYTYTGTSTLGYADPTDDAAKSIWGGNWRMPTFLEIDDIIKHCNWEWVSDYNGTGVPGYKVSGQKSGYTNNYIFLPATGMYSSTDCFQYNTVGAYWTTIPASTTGDSYWMYFDKDGKRIRDQYYTNKGNRWLGFAIRPVCK